MRKHVLAALVIGTGVGSTGIHAQDAPSFVWANSTELSFVSAGGNSSSSTLEFKSNFTGSGERNTFTFDFGGIRGESTFRSLTATGTEQDFSVTETKTSELTVENYFARGQYERSFGQIFGFGGAGWDRNTFAGVQNRYALVVGAGSVWTDTETGRLKTDLGATYTIQKDVTPAPGAEDGFAGLRLTVDAMRQLTESTEFRSELIVDENLADTEDLRANWINSFSVSMSDRLALKASLRLLFDNQPSLLPVPLFDNGGVPSGVDVLTPGEELDTVVTLTLVISL